MSADAKPGRVRAATSGAEGDETASDATPALRMICWGTRGSIPSPGPATVHFGGNTPCLEVRTRNGRRLIFDAGTGIRALGNHLAASGAPVDATLFLSHFHWDHIQGIPFFAPLYDERTHLRIFGARQNGIGVRQLLTGQMAPTHFPVPYDALAATLEYSDLATTPCEFDDVRVRSLRMRHPGSTYGFRVDVGRASVAFLPDNELVGGRYPIDGDAYDRFVEFLDGVDTLYHDAMYTEEEYRHRVGWGHSTFEQAVVLAERAGVRRLQLFHHAPDRGDAELHAIVERLRGDVARRGSALEVGAAVEGQELIVQDALPPPRTGSSSPSGLSSPSGRTER